MQLVLWILRVAVVHVLLGLFFAGWFAWALWLLALVWRRSPPFDATA